MPAMPAGSNVREGVLKGLYRFKATTKKDSKRAPNCFGSGAIMFEVLKAQQILEEKYGVGCDVWSVTSYKELYRDANDCERWNMLHPGDAAKVPYVTQMLKDAPGPVHCSVRLHEGFAGEPGQVGARTTRFAGHRRFRPQREPCRVA